MLESETDKSAGEFGQTRLEIVPAILGGKSQDEIEPLKAA